MAQIKVNGNATVITSALVLEDIKLIQKYNPEALTLRGGEDGKDPIFKIGVASTGTGSVTKFGATFDATTHNSDGKAVITMMLPESIEDVREYIADSIGAQKALLDKLEEALTSTAAEIRKSRKEIMDGIQMS